VGGRSACPSCHAVIAWYDDIPVVSWVVLRARCRRCATPISARYVVMEVATGAAFGTAAAAAPNAPVLGALLAAVSLLVVLAAMVAFTPGGHVERPPR
jgi:leader peptidase (prepilin peptidase) / N-methyltransferase